MIRKIDSFDYYEHFLYTFYKYLVMNNDNTLKIVTSSNAILIDYVWQTKNI